MNESNRAGEVIRTFEKNGKPYQVVIELCPRCGGSGHYSYNQMDGTKCYGCYGRGINTVERRVYTEKEKAALERAKIKRQEKKQLERAAEIEKKENERQDKFNEYISTNPLTYAVIDKDSYNKREMLKENGYRWVTWYWVGHKELEGIEVIEMDTKEVVNEYLSFKDTVIRDKVRDHKNAAAISSSKYQGTIGDKVNMKLTYKRSVSYETMYGNQFIHLFEDNEGNVYKWNTNKSLGKWTDNDYIFVSEGQEVNIKGTIKGHEEYNSVKQTELTRCKVDF